MDAALAPLTPAVSTLGDLAQTAGVIVAALLAAAALLARTQAGRAWAMIGAATLTPVLLLAHIWSSEQLDPLLDRPVAGLGAAALGLLALAGAGLVIHRRPWLLAAGAAAALPFRIPIESGGDTANLLVPLYLVIGAGVLAYAVPRVRGPVPSPNDGAPPAGRRWLEWLLGATLVLYAVQAAYSSDFDRALIQVVFFYVPFALLFALLARLPWDARLAARCLGVLFALAAVFVGIGFVEYATRELLLNPKVISSNQFESYFRVNSLFFDPNIYGRFLAVVMLGIATVVLFSGRTRTAAIGALALALLFAGLVLTLSQSSFAALLAGLAVLGALRWTVRRTAAVATAFAVGGVGVVLLAPGAVNLDLGSSASADAATSGRYDLVTGGVELFAERPVQGWGAGAFRREFRRQEKTSDQRAAAASHTIPVTVAAEQGVVGLAVYLALLAAALARLLPGAARSVPRAAVAAAFVALVVHTFLYAAFLEDPLAWVLLAAGTALARREP